MIINYIIVTISIILFAHYLFFLLKILAGLYKLPKWETDFIPSEFVTVIIPFRNESDCILDCLKSIEKQDYPIDKYEVLFVNDSSTDNSFEKLENSVKSENIKVLNVPESFNKRAHKKRAIKFGIDNAKGEIFVTTDADCIHKNNWLKTLLSGFDKETGLISGPVEFIDQKGLFYQFQKLEFASLIITGAGLIGADDPTICNAANLAYRKSAYLEVNGFEGQLQLSSGDDEILMQRIKEKTNYKIKFCPNKDAISFTHANDSLKKFYNQRKRWASKSLFYEKKNLVISLLLIFLFYINLLILAILSFITPQIYLPLLLATFLLKCIFEFIILKKGCSILFNNKILKYFLPAEIIHIPYIIISSISGLFGNFVWKDRVVER